ncbi:tRNA (5-methylaminomethyl-2-thiouridine)(34)-methyltransferase MnmD [Nonlabens ponticola]|uniref:SAM-dependent methyltransferase n=1 Tax=Nonlabens ponticola TaxID=2496866 RepID=A0A3S9MZH7_9FLAO|nr:tRNA (5-methylaminomethyl-2-thiouridine)(34)-methyltransferase MnmD [Nonlabens ponticola]AZQ44534.1 SAM-dependent methyltransferase [Nonlabens ponticola]
MKREIMVTGDGSKTIHMPDLNEQYHSKHGALQEARHVFIQTGLRYLLDTRLGDLEALNTITILEYGLGTGLNAMLTVKFLEEHRIRTYYKGIEAFPITDEEIAAMDYGELVADKSLYTDLHAAAWEKEIELRPNFYLIKSQLKFEDFAELNQYDLIYFDAFGPRTQPELWSQEIFNAAYKSLKEKGVLTTYCAAGQVRRNMQAAGFKVERLAGPPGKREMLRATK